MRLTSLVSALRVTGTSITFASITMGHNGFNTFGAACKRGTGLGAWIKTR
ncbi:MAG: hypothetical protein ACKVQK_22705 [Burkholderiales bacterium]